MMSIDNCQGIVLTEAEREALKCTWCDGVGICYHTQTPYGCPVCRGTGKTMNTKKQHVSDLEGLTITSGQDGVWINFSHAGKHTSINLSNYGKENRLLSAGLLAWCENFARESCGDSK